MNILVLTQQLVQILNQDHLFLHTNWKGPLRVVSGAHSQFLLLDLVTHKEKVYHVTDMKPFLFNPALTDPLDVSHRDYLEYFVESIIEHRGNNKSRKTDLQFLVKWKGYEDDHNSWEPYANLREVAVLHEYLKVHRMHSQIPLKHRNND